MKNTAIIIFLAAAIALGGLCFRQSQVIGRQEMRIAALEKATKESAPVDTGKTSAGSEKKIKELRSQLSQSAGKAAERSSQIAQLQEQLAAAQTNADPTKGFADMFKNPEMKDMIKAQQKAFMGPMLEKTYGGLYRRLKLNDEQKDYLQDLLEKKMMAGVESGMEMFGGKLDKAKAEEIGKQVAEQTKEYDKQIKDYLGDENYKLFEYYEKTSADRMQLSQFNEQSYGGETRLNSEQEEQIVQLMSEERKGMKFNPGFAKEGNFDGNFAAMFTDEKIDQFAAEQDKMNERVLARAQQILSADQYKAFAKFLTVQRDMQVTGMKFSAKMFAPKEKP